MEVVDERVCSRSAWPLSSEPISELPRPRAQRYLVAWDEVFQNGVSVRQRSARGSCDLPLLALSFTAAALANDGGVTASLSRRSRRRLRASFRLRHPRRLHRKQRANVCLEASILRQIVPGTAVDVKTQIERRPSFLPRCLVHGRHPRYRRE